MQLYDKLIINLFACVRTRVCVCNTHSRTHIHLNSYIYIQSYIYTCEYYVINKYTHYIPTHTRIYECV